MRILLRSEFYVVSVNPFEVLVDGLSHNLIIFVCQDISTRGEKVAGSNETEGALETDKNQHEDDVCADRADEHDEIEDCHEHEEICYEKAVISTSSRCLKGLRF